ncbi:Flavinator of succinate dehydrogenase [Canicola haemoglobinophilus]|uniref:FAD assembly factor SdhE n=1 Tax=Canicola haemoglobinophilus TaxID=733 RepID=A0AB38HAY0_9PAST|nr:succinate dehydrogenase assembly factor 2 [Canicola haemoglobinophilus]STO55134.1 Flavinator of succinate dehydrogenase [Canicola haemoglobinophilus]STO69295.1 Flavinator of succinate dehydrogenase [Canicola haemoglobinophilus]
MEKYNKFRIEWDCRRGMLELDKVIMPFFQQYFDELPDAKKDIFLRLLACSDLQLFSCFFNRTPAADLELQEMVDHIQEKLNLHQ